MRGGLKALLAPDIPVELVSGRRLSSTATPAAVRADRGLQLNGATLSIPVTPFVLSRAVTILLITRTPSGTSYPGNTNILQFNGGAGVVPVITNTTAAGIKWTPAYTGATAINASGFFNPSERKILWAQSRSGSHLIRMDGVDSTEDTSASYDPLTVTSLEILGLDAAAVVSYLAVFDRYLDAADRTEIERNPRILTQRDLIVVGYAGPTVLVGTNATVANTASTPALTQTHVLAGSSASSAHTAGTGALTQTHALAAANASSATTAGTGAITQTPERIGKRAVPRLVIFFGPVFVAVDLHGAAIHPSPPSPASPAARPVRARPPWPAPPARPASAP